MFCDYQTVLVVGEVCTQAGLCFTFGVLIVCCSIYVILVWSSAVFSGTSSSISLFCVASLGVGMCWRGLYVVSRHLDALGPVCGGGVMFSKTVVTSHPRSCSAVFGGCA